MQSGPAVTCMKTLLMVFNFIFWVSDGLVSGGFWAVFVGGRVMVMYEAEGRGGWHRERAAGLGGGQTVGTDRTADALPQNNIISALLQWTGRLPV